jgi:uncharacterized protein involved in exopolysaccharide biosynthesis
MQSSGQNENSFAAQWLSMQNKKLAFDWRQYWFLFWRRKWWPIASTFLFTCGGVVYALFFIRPVYEATTTIQVAPSRLLNRSVQTVTTGGSFTVDHNQLRRNILSTKYLTELIHRLKLTDDKKALQTAHRLQRQAQGSSVSFQELLERVIVENLRKNIKLVSTNNSEFFQLSAQHESPVVAYNLVKTLTEIFIEEAKRNELRGIRGIMEFSNEQLGIYKAKVDEAEAKLRRFEERMALSQTRRAGLSNDNIVKLQELISSYEIAISDRQRRVAEIEKLLPANAKEVLWQKDPELLRMQARIDAKLANFKKSVTLTSLQNNYEITLNNDINLLRQECQLLLARTIVRLYPDAEVRLQQAMISFQLEQINLYILNERVKIADEALNNFLRMAATAPADQLELKRLQDDLEQTRRVFKLFSEQSRGSEIEEALQNSDAQFKYSVFEPSRIPIYAVSGSKRLFVMFCLAAGLVLGVTMIFLLEFLDQSIRSADEVEELLHIPIWGTIPKLEMPFIVWYRNLEKPIVPNVPSMPAPPAGEPGYPIFGAVNDFETDQVREKIVSRLQTVNARGRTGSRSKAAGE